MVAQNTKDQPPYRLGCLVDEKLWPISGYSAPVCMLGVQASQNTPRAFKPKHSSSTRLTLSPNLPMLFGSLCMFPICLHHAKVKLPVRPFPTVSKDAGIPTVQYPRNAVKLWRNTP